MAVLAAYPSGFAQAWVEALELVQQPLPMKKKEVHSLIDRIYMNSIFPLLGADANEVVDKSPVDPYEIIRDTDDELCGVPYTLHEVESNSESEAQQPRG